jgi:peptidoglycan/xylan/chitin deacetylase (PgdA/CDA1 family)
VSDPAARQEAMPAGIVSRRRLLATIGGGIVLTTVAAVGLRLAGSQAHQPRAASPRGPEAGPRTAVADEERAAASMYRTAAVQREAAGHLGPPYPLDKPLYYIEDDDKAIALTIDDGPSPVYTPQVLDLLAQYQVTATFSMIGIHVAAYPQLARSVADAGHRIANHTWTHADLPPLGAPAVRSQMAQATDAISNVTGVQPRLFRAPYGAWSPAVIAECEQLQMIPLDWSVDPRDWARPGVTSIVNNIMENTRPGSIILEHDGGGDRSETVAALRIVLPRLLDEGFKFQTP